MYVRLFFEFKDGYGYSLAKNFLDKECKYCGCKKTCARKSDERVQHAMMHMYVDLSLKTNRDLTNTQRRYICCTYYVALVFGCLKKGERYEVDKCVRAEMKELFPSEKYIEYKDP